MKKLYIKHSPIGFLIIFFVYNLLLGRYSDIAPKHVLYTIKYAVEDEETCSHIATYDRAIGGYTEYRKFPNINLHCYNDIESLEQLNNVNNGVLCN